MSKHAKQTRMRVYDGQNNELMAIRKIERDGSDLLVSGKIFGAMPIKARIKPEEARAALKLLDFRTILFILTLPFRRAPGDAND